VVRLAALTRMARLVLAFSLLPTAASAQQYTVSVEETGALPTVYQKRHNWRYLTGYRHTTMVASSTDPNACAESPCLDDGEPGDQPPDSSRGGTATATVSNMERGTYRLALRYNQTNNRCTAVPWTVSTDATENNERSGSLDQRHTAPNANNWLTLGETGQSPLAVQSTLTFVLGDMTTTFDGSLSYGGIRLTKIADLPLSAPTISPPGGTFAAPVEVTVSSPDIAVELAYSTDGSPPELGATTYAGPFVVESSSTVLAAAFVGAQVSELATAEFVIVRAPTRVRMVAWAQTGVAAVQVRARTAVAVLRPKPAKRTPAVGAGSAPAAAPAAGPRRSPLRSRCCS